MKTMNVNSEPKTLQLVFTLLLILVAHSFLAGQPTCNQKQANDSLTTVMASLVKSSDNQLSKIFSTNYSVSVSGSSEFASYEFMEEKLVLEDWMLDPHHISWTVAMETEKEEDIELEPWMLDLSAW